MNEIKQFFGKNLKKIRIEHNYTQEKLAEKIGINQRQLTRIETGKSFPSVTTLDNICNVLCIPANELFDFSNYCEILKNGTDKAVYYIAQKANDNVILLQEKFPKYREHSQETLQEPIKEVLGEAEFFKMAKNLKRPIYVEYFKDKNLDKKVTYNPNGTSSVEIGVSKNEEVFNQIIDDLNSIKTSLPRLKFIQLAVKCLENKVYIEKMRNVLDGMAL